MGLFGSNKQSQSTDVDEQSAGANVGGNTTAPVTSTAVTIGGSGKSPITGGTFNFTDAGTVNKSFDFAGANQEKTFEFLSAALGASVNSLNTSRDAIANASRESLNVAAKALEPAEEKDQQRNVYVIAGVLLLVGFIFYVNKG